MSKAGMYTFWSASECNEEEKKYICDVLEIVLLEPNVMTFLVATAHRRKTTDNCAVFIRSISLLNAQSNMFLFTRLPSFLTRLLVDLPACLMRLR